MYPTLFRIPYLDFPISTFGVMMAIAFLVGTWITAKRMAEEGLDPELATTLLIYAHRGNIERMLDGTESRFASPGARWLRRGQSQK